MIIPAYNEESRIGQTLELVTAYLRGQKYSWEVLVANDGSADGTAEIVKGVGSKWTRVRLLDLRHGGKGWAVRNGMLQARGRLRFLCDADLSMPIEHIERFMSEEGSRWDVVIGSREAPGARRIGEPWGRHLMGRIFNTLTRLLAAPGIKDTQCGFKLFKDYAAERLFSLQRLEGFGFDAEVLFLARKLGYSVGEVGIDWRYQTRSKVSPVRDSLRMVADLFNVRWAYRRGVYKDKEQPQ
ncbi:MAG: glycosyltransferase family 2 protein [SAR202 cluster bacterium]|nr:glycosyltransferase family 2 protein [SAR202 cluster bacterium]